MTYRWLYYTPLIVLGLLVAYLALGLGQNPAIVKSVLINKEVPQFSLPPIEGSNRGLSNADLKHNIVLVNIFGGIVRCDLIAEGIMAAVEEVGVEVPVVVRLEGNRAPEALEILNSSKLNIIAAQSLLDAAQQVVKASKGD